MVEILEDLKTMAIRGERLWNGFVSEYTIEEYLYILQKSTRSVKKNIAESLRLKGVYVERLTRNYTFNDALLKH